MTPKITKTEDRSAGNAVWSVWILFGFLIVFVYFFDLDLPFVGPDEPRYAQIAREMLERGDWITPTLGGFNWFEKPPLLYWTEMISYKLIGVSEFAARLGPALFGVGTIASLWILGRLAKPKTTGFANYLVVITASSFGLIAFSHAASFDIIITFPMTAALVCFYAWHLRDETHQRQASVKIPLVLFYVFCGVGLLAKGLIGIVFPFAIVCVFYLFQRRLPSRMFFVSLVWGTLLAVAIASVWYLPMYRRHGYQFVDEFFVQHHFQRFASNKYQHTQPIYFFFWVLPLMTLPWLPFFLAALWKVVIQLFHRDKKDIKNTNENIRLLDSSTTPLHLFFVAWILVPLLFFSFSGSKLPGYVLPALPAAMILTSAFVFELVRNSNKWRNSIWFGAALTLGVVIVLLTYTVPEFSKKDSVKTLIQAANARGFTSNRVLTLHTISQNAEFYAAGRLLRDEQGKQRQLEGVGQVMAQVGADGGGPALVLVPVQYLPQLTQYEKLTTEVLKDNGELAIAIVSIR